MKSSMSLLSRFSGRLRWGLICLVVITTLIVLWYGLQPNVDPQVVIESKPQTVTVPRSLQSSTLAITLPVAKSVATLLTGETRMQMLDRLIAGTPVEAFSALNVINLCVTSRGLEAREKAETDPILKAVYLRSAPPTSAACDGVLAGHLTQRLPLAFRAAEAGVPGAFGPLWALAHEVDDRDPTFAAKWPAIRERYIQAADPEALSESLTLSANCSPQPMCRDEYRELVHLTALQDVIGPQPYETAASALTQHLGAERATQAIEAGHALVATAKGSK